MPILFDEMCRKIAKESIKEQNVGGFDLSPTSHSISKTTAKSWRLHLFEYSAQISILCVQSYEGMHWLSIATYPNSKSGQVWRGGEGKLEREMRGEWSIFFLTSEVFLGNHLVFYKAILFSNTLIHRMCIYAFYVAQKQFGGIFWNDE